MFRLGNLCITYLVVMFLAHKSMLEVVLRFARCVCASCARSLIARAVLEVWARELRVGYARRSLDARVVLRDVSV